MTFRVREVCEGTWRRVRRLVDVSILVVPGVRLEPANRARDAPTLDELPGLSPTELAHAVTLIRQQSGAWQPFFLVDGPRTLHYELTFKVEASHDPRYVRYIQMVDQGFAVADPRGELRGWADVMQEATPIRNVAAVHPWITGNPHARLMRADGGLRHVPYAGELMGALFNIMLLSLTTLQERMNLTAAHEIGHLLGIGHPFAARDSEPRLMGSSQLGGPCGAASRETCTPRSSGS